MRQRIHIPRTGASLATTLAIAFFILSAVVLLISNGLQLFSSVQTQQETISSQQHLIAQDASRTVSNFIQEKFGVLETSVDLMNPERVSQEEQSRVLERLLGLQPAFRQLVLLNAQDQELTAASRLWGSTTEQFIAGLESDLYTQVHQNQRYISPIYIDEATSEPIVTIAVPVKDVFEDFKGSVVAEVDLSFMWDLVDQLQVGKTGYAYVVDASGNLIAYNDIARVLWGENVGYVSKVNEFINDPLSLDLKEVSSYSGINGDTVIGTYVPLGTPTWAVVTELPWREAYQQVIRQGIWSIVIILITGFLAGVVGVYVARRLTVPVVNLMDTADRITEGEMDLQASVAGPREVRSLATAFNSMTTQLRQTLAGLEQRVANRTRALETSAEVSRRLSTLLNQQELISAVVENVQQAFDYYHVHIYLLDETSENLVMAGGTGDAGQAMLQSGHKIPVGKGLVGRAAETNEVVLVTDTISDPNWLPNPLLPDTRSEAAIPIAVGKQLLGILDVQENVVDGLTEQDIALLRSIANQTAVALQNARQYEQTQEAYQEVERSQERLLAVLEIGRMAMWEFDIVAQEFILNDQFYRVIGYDVDEVGGYVISGKEYVTRFVHPEDARMVIDVMRREPEDSAPNFRGRLEYRIFRGNGELQYVLAEYRIERDESGKPSKAYGFHMDVTDRKKAELASTKQAQELAIVAQVGTEATTILDPQELLQLVVDLVKSSFDLYHAHAYLMNEDENALELSAGSGEIGREMVSQGRRIPMTIERSLVARAARERQGVIVNDVRSEPKFLPNEFLPETASEMAIPLIAGERVLGVLDLQSNKVDRFESSDIAVQTALATQVAVALQNARQYQQVRQSEELTRTIINATPDWIFIKNREHRFQLVNKGYADSLHLLPEDIIGKDDLDLGFPEEIVKGDLEQGIRGFWPDDDQVMEEGKIKVVPSEPAVLDGEQHWLSTVKVPLKDESGAVWGVLGFVRDITDRERLRQETEERLQEINTLYRAMSRESWQAFHERSERENAFYFDRSAVQPAGDVWLAETQRAMVEKQTIQTPSDRSVLATPLALRGDVIGALAVELSPEKPLSDEEMNLLDELSEQVVLALESARLFEQTQFALGETETLYNIIAEMNTAENYDDILNAVADRTILDKSGLVLMGLFDHPMSDETSSPTSGAKSSSSTPEWIIPVSQRGDLKVEIAPRYPLSAFESTPNTLFSDKPVVLKDVDADKRLDSVTRTLFKEVFMAESVIVVPLRLADQTIGFIQGMYTQPVEMTSAEIERLVAVAGQAAIAVQSQLLLEQAQSRAQQEQRIREVTAQVFEAADVQTIMRRAVEQVGRALGMPTYIYLGGDHTKPEAVAVTELGVEELP